MAAIDRGLDSLSFLSDAMRDALRRRLREVGGLTLIVLATLVALALATWSVQDPSLSHATNAHVRNILGVSGAIVADLLTQLFGLAALAFILPIAIWGWRLVTHRPMRRERVRLLFWLLGVLLTAGCAAALPRSSAWPLPVGLGGVIGDWMLRLPAALSGGTLAGPARIAVAVASGAGMLLCFTIAAGFGWRAEGDDAEGPFEEDEARGWIPLGWITHGFLSLKARLARAQKRRPSARAPARSETPQHARVEPRFAAGARTTLQPAVRARAAHSRRSAIFVARAASLSACAPLAGCPHHPPLERPLAAVWHGRPYRTAARSGLAAASPNAPVRAPKSGASAPARAAL